MSELDDIYQEIVLEHSRKPRNFRKIDEADQVQEGYNPLCGDKENMKEDLGDIEVLQGVSEYPTRIKCATLSWHAMHAAVEDQEGDISTEKV